MLIYDGAALTRIVNKVLGKSCAFLVPSVDNKHVRSTDPVQFPFVCVGLGMEATQHWLDADIVGCLKSFSIEC